MNDLAQKNPTASGLLELDLPHLDESFFFDGQSAESFGEKQIVFNLSGQFYAFPSKKVSEVVSRLAMTPLPNVPEWLLGIADLRGSIISVVSLQKLLNLPDAAVSSKTKFIVLKLENLPSTVAVCVDKIGEIIALPTGETQPSNAETMPFLSGKTMHKSNVLNLLNVENLLASLTI